MYSAYSKFESILNKIEQILVVIPFVLIFVTVVEQVFVRYLNLPLEDSSEISTVCQALFTFFGIGMLTYSEGHITIEVHKMIKNFKILAIVECISYVLMIVFAALYIYLGYDLFAFALDTGTATTQLRIPLSLPYGAMLVGFICLIIHAVGKIMRVFAYRNNLGEIYGKEADIDEMR